MLCAWSETRHRDDAQHCCVKRRYVAISLTITSLTTIIASFRHEAVLCVHKQQPANFNVTVSAYKAAVITGDDETSCRQCNGTTTT